MYDFNLGVPAEQNQQAGSFEASQFSVRTSDRRTYRRCHRKWNWQSSLRQNLRRKGTEQNIHFWFGSAIHFCMEDFHGHNLYKDLRRALYAYYQAFDADETPPGAEGYYSLGLSMLTYYNTWMQRHNKQTQFETVWFDGDSYNPVEATHPNARPGVEISFYIPLHVYTVIDAETGEIGAHFSYNPEWGTHDVVPFLEAGWSPRNNPEQVYFIKYGDGEKAVKIVGIFYHGTIDRIVVDRYGRYWLWDYKTAKAADKEKLDTDDQVSAYLWAARQVFPFPIYGFVYLQMTKDKIKEPKRLKNGELSVDKRQKTTYGLLRAELIKTYGSVNQAPDKLIQFLNHLAAAEEPEGDRFIRWDFVKRTSEQLDSTQKAIYAELNEMLNTPDFCYPSPTRDCVWDCPFRDACVMYDKNDTSGLEAFFADFEKRPHSQDGNLDEWRTNLTWPIEGREDTLVDMDTVLHYNEALVIADVDSEETEDSKGGFAFYYEEDC